MKLLKTVITASLLLAVVQSASALEKLVAVESAAEHNSLTWISQYYKNPQPELLVRRAYVLSEMGYFEQEGQPAQAIGFFSTVFAKYPDRVDGWIAAFRGLPLKHQRLLAAAAWLSGQPRGASRLQELSSSSDNKMLVSLLNHAPAPVAQTAVLSASSMNLHWGAFVASGNESHIISILTAIGEETPGLAESATLSLAINAAQDERVMQICQTQLDKQPKAVQDIFRAALNDAKTNAPPAS
jgi:hypothetical protein